MRILKFPHFTSFSEKIDNLVANKEVAIFDKQVPKSNECD